MDIRQALLSHSWNMGFSSFLWTKYMENCEAMISSTNSFAYSYWLFKKRFDENYGNSNFDIFLICYPIYIKCSQFCSKCFNLSIDLTLNLNLGWIFPLNLKTYAPIYFRYTVRDPIEIKWRSVHAVLGRLELSVHSMLCRSIQIINIMSHKLL